MPLVKLITPKLGYHLTLSEIYEYPLKALFKPKADHVYPADVIGLGLYID